MIFYIYGINSAQAENPISFLLCFRGLNDVIMTCKIKGVNILEGGRPRSEGSEQTEAGGQKQGGPRGQVQGPRGATSFGPRVLPRVHPLSSVFLL